MSRCLVAEWLLGRRARNADAAHSRSMSRGSSPCSIIVCPACRGWLSLLCEGRLHVTSKFVERSNSYVTVFGSTATNLRWQIPKSFWFASTDSLQAQIAFVGILLSKIFFWSKILEMFVAKDIQSCCMNFREMKDVFKELKVLGRKGKSCTSKINKGILETF